MFGPAKPQEHTSLDAGEVRGHGNGLKAISDDGSARVGSVQTGTDFAAVPGGYPLSRRLPRRSGGWLGNGETRPSSLKSTGDFGGLR